MSSILDETRVFGRVPNPSAEYRIPINRMHIRTESPNRHDQQRNEFPYENYIEDSVLLILY